MAANGFSHAGRAARKVTLLAENLELVKEVDKLRAKFTMAQVLNAVPQIHVPSASLTAPAPPSEVTPAVETQKATEEAAPAASNAKKSAKASKPASTSAKTNEPSAEKVDISRLDLRIGQIISAQKHPEADNLYLEEVSFGGDSKKTVISGLAKHIPLEQMQNRVGIFLCNLKPAKLKGILSEAMIMCGNKDGTVEIIDPPEGCQPGDRVTVTDFPGEPDAQLPPKKNIWEQVMPDLRLNDVGVATYKGIPWSVIGRAGICKCPLVKDAQIK